MLKKVIFRKQLGEWYLVAPKWGGPLASLRIINGVNSLLESISSYHTEKSTEITLLITDFYIKNCDIVLQKFPNRCEYNIVKTKLPYVSALDSLWLCPLIEIVWKKTPSKFYIDVLNVDLITEETEHKTTIKDWFKWFLAYFKRRVN